MATRKTDKGRAIIFAIISGNEILLIRQPDRREPKWKMPGETVNPGESLAHAIRRGVREETGLVIPLPVETPGGKLFVENNEVRVGELHRQQISNPTGTHTQYFYAIILKSRSKLRSLGGETFPEDETETISTKVFDIRIVAQLPDFLERQRLLLEILLKHLPKAGKAAKS